MRVSLDGMLAVVASNFCFDFDLKPGKSCSVKNEGVLSKLVIWYFQVVLFRDALVGCKVGL